jgi:hypothetical protein
MGGSGFIGALPSGASSWCQGDDVVQKLNDVFHSDPNPTNPHSPYQLAKTASLALFQDAAASGRWQDLLAAYVEAFDAADPPFCAGWGAYLQALGSLSGDVGSIATTSSTAANGVDLIFGPGNIPAWMANGLGVRDSLGAITGGQTVLTFDNKTVTLSAPVTTMVNAGDIVTFSFPAGLGTTNIQTIAQNRYAGLTANKRIKTFKHDPHTNPNGHNVNVTQQGNEVWIDSPYIAPSALPRNRRRYLRELLRWLQQNRRR